MSVATIAAFSNVRWIRPPLPASVLQERLMPCRLVMFSRELHKRQDGWSIVAQVTAMIEFEITLPAHICRVYG